jgi:hypothetical protein
VRTGVDAGGRGVLTDGCSLADLWRFAPRGGPDYGCAVTQTLDPNTFPSIGSFIDDEVQFLEVLFHPDLRRIGDRCTLGSTARDGVEMVVGRARPAP